MAAKRAASERAPKEEAVAQPEARFEAESVAKTALPERTEELVEQPVAEAPVDNRPGRSRRKAAASRAAAPKGKQADVSQGRSQKKSAQPKAQVSATPGESLDEAAVVTPETVSELAEKVPAARKPRRAKVVAAPVADQEVAPLSAVPVVPEGGEAVADVASADPQAYIHQLVTAAEPDGIALATLGKRVRGKFRTFKLRDLGYSQFRPYLADLEGIEVEQRDGQFYARLAR